MNNFEIIFSRPWLLLLMIPVAAIILLPFLRLPRQRRKMWKKYVPVILHMVICTLLVLCLAGLTFVTTTNEQSVMILMDLSDSTAKSHGKIVTYANSIKEGMDENCGIIAFAGDCVYEVKLKGGASKANLTKVVAADTDIAGAMEYAASLLPNDTNRRIILLSDGKQTSGDANATASALAKKGFRIDAVYFESTYLDNAEMQISDVALPDNVYAGDPIDILVTVDSNVTGEVDVVLSDGEDELERTTVNLQKGTNTVSFRTVAKKVGVHVYNVSLETNNDSMSVNNQMYTFVNVAGESGVLVIVNDSNQISALKAILDPACDLTVVRSKNAPTTIIELCNYDEVILVNVDTKQLPKGFDALLSSYVSDFGRSVLTIGGKNTYMYGNMEGTLFEEMMPVDLELNEDAGKTVALMLVLDCSGSMSNSDNFLSMAKQSAIQSVNAMLDKDYVGIISFNRYAYLESPLVQATNFNKMELNQIISSLTTSQGTYYERALSLAHEVLLESTAESKHVIFLSDGEPNDSGYGAEVLSMEEDGITVSTIALGYASKVLESLADLGGGRYYTVKDVTDLPEIMLSETEQVTISSLIKGEFVPVINIHSPLTEGLEDTELPLLHGYLGVTMKKDAQAILTAESGNPIYAMWDYGMGTVASFMSDLEGEWSSQWLSTELGKTLIRRMMSTTIDDTHNDSSIRADYAQGGSLTHVTVECITAGANHSVELTVATPDEQTQTYQLSQVRPGVFQCKMDTPVAGIYQTMLVQYDEAGNPVDSYDTALAVSYSGEYNAFAEDGDSLLMSICSHSGGMVTTNVTKLTQVEMESVEIYTNPLIAFAIFCGALMLADFIIRLLRWKDVKEFIAKLKKLPAKD